MPYRRTANVIRRLAEREQAIVAAAQRLAGEGGMAAVQVANVAERARSPTRSRQPAMIPGMPIRASLPDAR